MDNDEYIYDEGLEEQESSSYSKKGNQSNKTLDNGKKLIDKARDGSLKEDYNKVKEGVSKIKSGDKSGVGDIMDGTDAFREKGNIEKAGSGIKNAGETLEKVGDAAKKAGSGIKNAGKAGEKAAGATEKGAEAAKNAAKAAEAAGKATEAAGKATKAAGQATKAAGAATRTAGQTASTVGDSINAAGVAADATGVGAVAGVPMNVIGTVASAGGKATAATGAATEASGAATEAAGAATEAAGKATQAGAKAGKATAQGVETGAKFGKNAGKLGKTFGDKLEKFGESAKETGEKVKEVGKKVEKFGKYTTSVVKTLANPAKMLLISIVVILLTIILFFGAVLQPLFGAMNLIKQAGDQVEKYNNFLNGLGFENCIDAFYDELNYVSKHYDNALNDELLMATLFYTDSLYDEDVLDKETDMLLNAADGNLGMWGSIYSALNYLEQEATSEKDEMGRVYTANKIFRIKDLAKHMVEKSGETRSVSLTEYIGLTEDQVGTDFRRLSASSSANINYEIACWEIFLKRLLKTEFMILAPGIWQIICHNQIFAIDQITNNYLETKLQDSYAAVQNFYENIDFTFEDLVSIFTDIESVEIEITFNDEISLTITFDGGLPTIEGDGSVLTWLGNLVDDAELDIEVDCNIEYEVYSYDEEGYEDYLKDTYLREMPEFKDYIVDGDGEISDDRVDELYENIEILAMTWEELNEEADASAFINDVCIGDINPNLLDQLHLPIDLTEGSEVVFTNKTAYGVTVNGQRHNGVDLNEESVGVHAGDPVYAVADGRVTYTTGSGDYPGEGINGGGVQFEFSATYQVNDSANFSKEAHGTYTVVYEGLDPTRLPERGASFSKGDIIGYIGEAQYSEDGVTPGLHFEFIDGPSTTSNVKYRNPINMFITCSEYDEYSQGVVIHNTSHLMVHDIGLDQETFVEATQAHIKAGGRGANYLSNWDLNAVYKYSVKYNINPELIVIRAIVEGFSPYSQGYPSYNNYWGIGCYNGAPLSSCSRYSSFENGIKGFAELDIVRNSDTIEDMMSNYVNIGAVWFDLDHSNGGSGGCYYAEAESDYLRALSPERANLVLKTCNDPTYHCTSVNDSSCLRTNSYDQQAHVDYNCRIMNQLYDEMYSSYHSSVASGDVEAYIKVMVGIAEDDTHGYNMDSRYYNPDVDCTSLVYYGLVLSGTIPDLGGPFYTGNMGDKLKANGFTEYRYNRDILQRGDIIMYHQPYTKSDGTTGYNGHAVVYLGDGKQVAANGCKTSPRSCSPGDQADEVSVSNYYDGGHYQYIYRLE